MSCNILTSHPDVAKAEDTQILGVEGEAVVVLYREPSTTAPCGAGIGDVISSAFP